MAGVEGVEIKVLDHSVEIKQGAKNREIFLNKKAWQGLCACRIQLNDAIRAEKEFQHTLDKRRDIQVYTNMYRNKMYIHIRSWWNGRPMRTGVSMLIGEWDQVQQYLDPSDEMRLGIKVLRRILKEGKLLCTSLNPVQ